MTINFEKTKILEVLSPSALLDTRVTITVDEFSVEAVGPDGCEKYLGRKIIEDNQISIWIFSFNLKTSRIIVTGLTNNNIHLVQYDGR